MGYQWGGGEGGGLVPGLCFLLRVPPAVLLFSPEGVSPRCRLQVVSGLHLDREFVTQLFSRLMTGDPEDARWKDLVGVDFQGDRLFLGRRFFRGLTFLGGFTFHGGLTFWVHGVGGSPGVLHARLLPFAQTPPPHPTQPVLQVLKWQNGRMAEWQNDSCPLRAPLQRVHCLWAVRYSELHAGACG